MTRFVAVSKPLSSIACSAFLSFALIGCEGPPSQSSGDSVSALSLPGSQFETDDDANLVVDTSGNLDWGTVDDSKRHDAPSGQGDSSYKGGAKEDHACPATSTGSIPNNKSDLKTFGVYKEAGTPGYLHLFWSRVQDPSGTTLMDFEFNQSTTDCGNGVNPERTVGDLLLEYRLEQGGATATIKAREWDGANWGAETDLTAIGAATGTINSSAIADADSDGLGSLDPRTFGEAAIDLDYIFEEDKCTSFGSAFVKSRSSDAFNSALKDYIPPTPINITNCGQVVIRKETLPDGSSDLFGFTHDLQTDPASGTSFDLADDQSQSFSNVLFGTNYTVTEDALPGGVELADIDCSASSGVVPAIDVGAGTVTFDIDSDQDVVDCTYTNQYKGEIIIEKITTATSGSFSFTSSQLGSFGLSTTGPGDANKDSISFSDLDPGTYDVTELVPSGWTLVSSSCDDGSQVDQIGLSGGETVTCTFTNARQTGAILIYKTRKHAGDGPGNHPHAGVNFEITGGQLAAPISATTDTQGFACIDGLYLSSFAGDYSVTENVPFGYVADGATTQTVQVTTAASCPNGDAVYFSNTPLTNITIAVDSIIPDGTASTITCTNTPPVATGPGGDGSLTLNNLLPGTYSCTVVVDP
jgi:hypothetical protein